MKIQKVKISSVKSNPDNPRIIKDDKFKKLVKSINEFPKMLEIRPIVVNSDMIVLGGNMRLKACKEAGLKEVFIIKTEDLTEEQEKEFIVKDNVGFGEWDFEHLTNEWDKEQLNEWGLFVPDWSAGIDENNMSEEEIDIEEEFDPIGTTSNDQRVVFLFDNAEDAENYLNENNVEFKKMNMAWQVNFKTDL